MPRFAANLHYLFNEVPFLERFSAAAQAGFQGVEFQVPYQWPAAKLSSLLLEHRLELALIDTPQGDWDAGERGLAVLPGREAEFRAGVQRAAEYAQVMRAGAVHLIAGVVPPETDLEAAKATYLENLKYGAEILSQRGVTAVIEPINPLQGDIDGGETYTTYGMRGFYLTRTEQALRAIEAVGIPIFIFISTSTICSSRKGAWPIRLLGTSDASSTSKSQEYRVATNPAAVKLTIRICSI